MKTRWIPERITGCMDFGRQTSDGAINRFLGAISFLLQHCVDGPVYWLPGQTTSMPQQPAVQRPFARHPAYSSACEEGESPESRREVRADRARECPRDKDRAVPRQRGDYPWQLLLRFPLCLGVGARYITNDQH